MSGEVIRLRRPHPDPIFPRVIWSRLAPGAAPTDCSRSGGVRGEREGSGLETSVSEFRERAFLDLSHPVGAEAESLPDLGQCLVVAVEAEACAHDYALTVG